jgi:hypothetical protein
VPPFVRIDVDKRVLSSENGARTPPISIVQRANGCLMLQAMQKERGAVVNEQSGLMSASLEKTMGSS